ncbi:MAG: TIGR02391 family protein [Chloroflexi bacterium]|nr:TIGR02391 family protein [Chloroflexota bacterium]MCL5074272.1 TIGR02391 family protein [Chloroflexota bacterium]
MVPVMLNFYSYKEKLKQAIVRRKAALDGLTHPLDWAWLTYALSQDGIANNPLFSESLAGLLSWAFSESAWSQERNLAALGLCAHLMGNDNRRYALIDKILSKLDSLLVKEVGKFSLLNDPEQVFCVILGVKVRRLSGSQCDTLRRISSQNSSTGRPMRRVLYTAALVELDKPPTRWPVLGEQEATPEDVIGMVWLYERYKEKWNQDNVPLWKTFENVKDSFTIESPATEDENLVSITNLAVGMLYEAVARQTQKPDVDMLFDTYPLHARVREIAEHDFKNKSYVAAVEQATKVLNELIQQKTEIRNKSEAELVQATMKLVGQPAKLKIKFNDYLQEESGKNEQAGLALIAEGVFKAFRNPKGHKPKDHPLIELDGYEALDQMVTISLLMKRIEEAKSPEERGSGHLP